INASKIKALPGKKIFSGPFNLVFADIPTPVGFLFGYFPTPQKRRSTGASGIIFPTFGEAREQGFYLRQGGYYLALNEYIGISLLGDIYSYGSWAAHVQSTYNKRYAYQGNFSFDFSGTPQYINNEQVNNPIVGPGRFPRQQSKSFFIRWSHSPAARPGGKLSASVQAGSSFYNRQNYSTPSNNLSATFNSSVQYQYANPNSPITFTASMLHNQNIITKVTNLTLPEATLSVNRQYPFRVFNKSAGGGNFLPDILVAYNLTASNQISNSIRSGSLPGVNLIGGEQRDTALAINGNTIPTILRNAQFGARHSFPISMNSIRILKHFNLSPSLYYNATSYLKELKYTYVESANAVRIDTLNRFSFASEYGAGASLSTRIYGMSIIKGKRLEAIRHQIQPSLSYNYTPNLTTAYGQYVQLSDVVNSTTGMVPYQYLSRYNGFLNAPSGSGLQSALYFSIQNNVEAKVKAKSDTAETFEKVSIIDNFSFTGGFNFAADSFKVQPINAQFRTVLFKRLNIFTSANLDPYQVNAAGRRLDRLMINQSSFRFARLTNANLNLDIDLNPDAIKSKREEAPSTNRPSLETDVALQQQYVDFNIPWTFRINYTASYFAQDNGRSQTTQSLGFDGSLSLTEKWKVTYSSGYDFLNKAITYTNLNIHRDLHCWEMSIGWIPFGVYQSYSININARSALLRDLKVSRNRSWYNR
ncbi:MAG: hypothetical protein JWQ14_828, partial [Adhaeribacter sp.]|nr:hypothetical protein [Adhaeribacter sp.]